MNVEHSVALVTGGNRGLGRHFVEELLARGAKVYAAARRPETVHIPGAIPLRVDVTDSRMVLAAAAAAPDVTLLINNAGISTGAKLIGGSLDDIRLEMETHYFGALGMTRTFAPVIARNGGGAILNVLSVLSWLHVAEVGAYCGAKAAAWAMTDAVRQQLAPQGINVVALHVGYMDTDMAANAPPEMKSDPAVVARLALDAIAAGQTEILADELSRKVKRELADPVGV
jgi:NAD(P)-dependent dehydrogenase (short-subunit alcohol dehydrogenase family)